MRLQKCGLSVDMLLRINTTWLVPWMSRVIESIMNIKYSKDACSKNYCMEKAFLLQINRLNSKQILL